MEEIPSNQGCIKPPVGMLNIPIIDKDFIHPRVVVWDFFHQPYLGPKKTITWTRHLYQAANRSLKPTSIFFGNGTGAVGV